MADKNFFFRIVAADFLAAIVSIPENERGQWATQLAIDLVNADEKKAKSDFSKKVILEAINFREKKKKAGQKGGLTKSSGSKQCLSSAKAELSSALAKPSTPLARSSNRSSNSNNTEKPKEKNSIKKESFDFKAELLKRDVAEQTASDYMMVRKQKKAANTLTAFSKLEKQVELSKQTWEDIIQICCERSWSGFKAEWLDNINFQQQKKKSNFDLSGISYDDIERDN